MRGAAPFAHVKSKQGVTGSLALTAKSVTGKVRPARCGQQGVTGKVWPVGQLSALTAKSVTGSSPVTQPKGVTRSSALGLMGRSVQA